MDHFKGIMKILVYFGMILSAVAITYPNVTSWGKQELEYVLTKGESYDISSLACLRMAFNVFTRNVTDTVDPTIDAVRVDLTREYDKNRDLWAAFTVRDTMAQVPSPMGRSTWNVIDLMDTAVVIIEDLAHNNKVRWRMHADSKTNKQTIFKVLVHTIKTLTRVKNRTSHIAICIDILKKLRAIIVELIAGRNNFPQTGYIINFPVVDVSMWTLDDLQQVMKRPTSNYKLLPFIDEALQTVDYSVDSRTGKICMVTPVSIIPNTENYYYLPTATKELLNQVRRIKIKKNKKSMPINSIL